MDVMHDAANVQLDLELADAALTLADEGFMSLSRAVTQARRKLPGYHFGPTASIEDVGSCTKLTELAEREHTARKKTP